MDKSQFSIGEMITLNGKEYKITGTKARSYILERGGKKYKATPDKMNKILDHNAKPKTPSAGHARYALTNYLAYRRIFEPMLNLPVTDEEFKKWFNGMRNELSPENLHCDGEISNAQAGRKRTEIKARWAELEALYGKKVPEYGN